MKITHPKAILFIIILVLAASTATAYVQARFMNGDQIGNPNPVIEWVVLEAIPKAGGKFGVAITIQGYNFTATGNEIRSRSKVVKTGLASVERLKVGDTRIPGEAIKAGIDPQKARIITFELPTGIPCSQGEQCPISVVNANGTSNTVSFRLGFSL